MISDLANNALTEVFATRRAQARMRVGLAIVMTAAFGGVVGWTFCFVWMTTYLLLQAVEFGLVSRGRRLPQWAMLVLLSTNSLVFGALAASGPFVDGAWGLACGIGLLCGALLNAALTSQRSGRAFVASMWPFVAYLVATPFAALAIGAPPHSAFSFAATGLLIVSASAMIWRAAAKALDAETAARARAEAADAAKSAFVAMVSHELRTPISAILAGAVEARKTDSAGDRQANLDLIASSGRMMRTLLDDLLDLSKIEAGKMGVEHVTLDLRRLVLETTRFWRPEARARSLRFRLEGVRTLPRWVSGDPTRIRQILNNLLSNALKFTEAGSVTLRISVEADGRFSLCVADTGPGMNAEQLSRLFQPFGQASDSVARTHGGTGLGLNISRELARLMDGDLTVVSAPGQGAAFTLCLPLPEVAAPADEDAEPSDLTLRVLVADDHEVNRRAFELILRGAGVDVSLACDGEEALERLALEPVDVVLMDLNMPRLGGLQATQRLRAMAGPNRQTPVIALTASVSPTETQACLAGGMDAFVMKPVEARELFDAIQTVLEASAERVREAG